MFYEIKGVCKNCAAEYKAIVVDSEMYGICPSCGGEPVKVKRIEGVIYVIDNPNQQGVKVGITSKDLDERIKKLSSTGVPGKFRKIAIFPSDKLKEDESRAHEKLSKYRLDKEHFMVERVDAVLAVYRALYRRRPIFYDTQIEDQFNQRLANDREIMMKRLGKSEDSSPLDSE